MRVLDIASGVPAWVYGLLIVLILLGARRLRTREMPVSVALIPAIAFLIWSIVGALQFAQLAGVAVALAAWGGGAALGAATAYALPEPRGQRVAGGRVRLQGSWLPMLLYLGVFVSRFACGTWAAIAPAQAITATGAGLAIGAAMTARLVASVLGWQAAPRPQLAG